MKWRGLGLVALLLAGPLAAQAPAPHWYGQLVLRNASLELYVVPQHPVWGQTPVLAVCSPEPPLRGQCWRFELQWAAAYATALREAIAGIAAGEAHTGERIVPNRGILRARCGAMGCDLTVRLVGQPESLRTVPPVDTARLRRYAAALDAAGKRDTTFPVIRDSLP